MSVVFKRSDQRIPDFGELPLPCTWDHPKWKMHEQDIALLTCGNRHTLRLNGTVHSVDAQGVVSPSWVCTAIGCTFHCFVRLDGWQPQ